MIPVKALVAMSTMGMGAAGMAGVMYLSTTPSALTSSTSTGPMVLVESVRVLEPDMPTFVDVPTEIVLRPVFIQTVTPKPARPRAATPAKEMRMQPCSDWLTMAMGPADRRVRELCAVRLPQMPGS